jgi:macrolide transport system ATP-binding/permease protein
MSLWRKLMYLVPWVRRREDRDMDEELRALRDLAGPRALGNVTLAAEDARAVMSWQWVERLAQDLRYAFRSMAHHKAFTALVVVSLALGIGANTAMFSFMDGVLLRPLPVNDPQSLAILKWRAKGYALATTISWSTDGTSVSADTGTTTSVFPYPALKVFQDSRDIVSTAFSYFVANRLSVTVRDATDSIKGQYVSGDYFAGMGVHTIAGRPIQPADDQPGNSMVVVLSHRYSQRRFGGPASAIGQAVRINDTPFAVIGVMPAAFFGAEPGAIPDVYMPMNAAPILKAVNPGVFLDQHYYWVEIMARLKPGVSLEQAGTVLAPRFRQFALSTATTDAQKQDLPALVVQSGATGLDGLRRKYSQSLYVLLAMVGLILLIACSNIANLLLSRASARRREIAVRLSIGASRGRVIRQLLTESVLLATIGSALGVAVAWWGIRVMTQLLSNGRDNFTLHAELNVSVLVVTLGLAVLTGLLFGLAPALQASRVDVVPALKEVRASQGPRRWRGLGLGRMLVVTQVVLSLVLLVAAGLFGRTLLKLHAIEPGFTRENVLLFTIRPSAVGYQGQAIAELVENIRQRLALSAGVQKVSLSHAPLPMGGGTAGPVVIADAPIAPMDPDGRPARSVFASVGPEFFETMQIPLTFGRDFTNRDRAGSPKAVVVNRRLARLFGVENPVGRTLSRGTERFEIVGVVEDSLAFSLKEARRPVVYFAFLQAERPSGQLTFEVRTAGNPLNFASMARETVRQVDSRIAIHELKTQAAHIDQAISTEITLARLCAAFAGLALLIACVGLYGTVAFNVARRTNEIGIRVTLGARRGLIIWMVLREVLVMTAVGLAIGVPLALFASRYVKTLLYGIEPTDPIAIAIGVAALLVCGLAAGLVPARRASRIDPMIAVRHE